jgi:hypothetical protein
MVCWALVVPVTWGLKTKVVGVTASVFAGVTPDPDRLMTLGLPGALWAMVKVAFRPPVAVGLNVTITVQELPNAPGGNVPGAGQLLLIAKSPEFTPPSVIDEMVTGDVPVLVRMTLGLMLLLVVFTVSGKTKLGGSISRA